MKGKAVFRVIDVDPLPPASAVASSPMTTGSGMGPGIGSTVSGPSGTSKRSLGVGVL